MRLTIERRWWRTSLVAAAVAILFGLLLTQISRAPETYPWGERFPKASRGTCG